MFYTVAQRLGQLLLLRAGPQDLPTSRSLLQVAAGLFLLFSVARLVTVTNVPAALAQSLLSLGLLWIYLRSLLNWRRTPERLTQTLTAVLLAGAVLGALLLLPLTALAPVLRTIAEDPTVSPQSLQVPAMAMYAWLGVSLWSLIVAGHIYRNALDTGLGLGVCVALVYEFLLIAVVGLAGSLF